MENIISERSMLSFLDNSKEINNWINLLPDYQKEEGTNLIVSLSEYIKNKDRLSLDSSIEKYKLYWRSNSKEDNTGKLYTYYFGSGSKRFPFSGGSRSHNQKSKIIIDNILEITPLLKDLNSKDKINARDMLPKKIFQDQVDLLTKLIVAKNENDSISIGDFIVQKYNKNTIHGAKIDYLLRCGPELGLIKFHNSDDVKSKVTRYESISTICNHIEHRLEKLCEEKNIDITKIDSVLKDLRSLKDFCNTSNFDNRLNKFIISLRFNKITKDSVPDLLELVYVMSQINLGRRTYIPQSGNFETSDVLILNNNSRSNVLDDIEMVSIKLGDGGAGATSYKIVNSMFSSDEIKKDLLDLVSNENFANMFSGDNERISASRSKNDMLYEKYKNEKDFEKIYESYMNSKEKAINKKRNTTTYNIDSFVEYLRSGIIMQILYNNHVTYQLFSNINYKIKYPKNIEKAYVEICKTDGVESLSFIKFSHDVGFNAEGKPGNHWPSHFKTNKPKN
jgi:hypothetical protein